MCKKGTLLKIIFIIPIILILSGCGKSSDVIVTFDSNGGDQLDISKIKVTDEFPTPSVPTRSGYVFAGWYLDEELTEEVNYKSIPTESITFYAKWNLNTNIGNTFNITYNLNGGVNSDSNPKSYTSSDSSIVLFDPVKAGYTFAGWFTGVSLETTFDSSNLPQNNITLNAKWVEDVIVENSLVSETLPIHSSLYGNTNGNLNNKGLAVYNSNEGLHYYSSGNSVYSYNPLTENTTVLFTLTTGGRATFMNLDGDILYYIDSSDGYLVSYDLVNHVFTTISETENMYASLTQNWINIIYPAEQYGTVYNALQRYRIDNGEFSSYTNGIQFMNIDGTRVYYTPKDEIKLSMMSYNGQGKTTISYFTDLNVEIIHEMLLLDVDSNYVPYYALILTVDGDFGLYTFDSNSGLVKVMDDIEGNLHSLNFDGNNLYVIAGSGLYEVNLETSNTEKVLDISNGKVYVQVINYWIYIGEYQQSTLYRINPDTKEIELLN